jgi:hypothetical protein
MTEFVQYQVNHEAQRAYEVKARQMRAEVVGKAVTGLLAFLRAQIARAATRSETGTARA